MSTHRLARFERTSIVIFLAILLLLIIRLFSPPQLMLFLYQHGMASHRIPLELIGDVSLDTGLTQLDVNLTNDFMNPIVIENANP